MKKLSDETGVAVVEATIYLPFVMAVFFFFLYMAYFYMEDYAMYYVADRAATEVAREVTYQGYKWLEMNEDKGFEFSWAGNAPSKDSITKYFKASHGDPNDPEKANIRSLYANSPVIMEILDSTGLWDADTSSYESKYDELMKEVSLLSGLGSISQPDIKVDWGLMSSTVTVTIKHTISIPGIVRYALKYSGSGRDTIEIKQRAIKVVTTPAYFVRDVELVCDITDKLLEKFDKNGKVKDFMGKVSDGIQKIL